MEEFLRHRLVVLAGVADVGEDLRKRLLVIDADEVLILRQVLLILIIGVDILAHIFVIALLMDETFHGQTV